MGRAVRILGCLMVVVVMYQYLVFFSCSFCMYPKKQKQKNIFFWGG